MVEKNGKLGKRSNTTEEKLKEAKAKVADLEKKIAEERRKIRTRGRILTVIALASVFKDEEREFEFYRELFEIDKLQKSSKASPMEKGEARRRWYMKVIQLAATLQKKMHEGMDKKDDAPGKDDYQGPSSRDERKDITGD